MPLTPRATRSCTPLICLSLSSLAETVATSQPSSWARADAAQHGDVERVVVLRERHADRGLALATRGRDQRQRGRKHERRGERGGAKPEHADTPLHCRERNLSAAAAAMITAPTATRCQ